jgi:iron(III) transport system substrate-binding protein
MSLPSRQRPNWVGLVLLLAACRIEAATPRGTAPAMAAEGAPSGELWVYTSAFPAVVDELEVLARQHLPQVSVRWFKAGSEKVASRIEGELAAGGIKCDVLAISDPFLVERYKREGLMLPYTSPAMLRLPRSLVDLDGNYAAIRVSTMVLAYRSGLKEPPRTFAELTEPKWRGKVALGDPIASGTAFTWVAFEDRAHGHAYFRALRQNGAVVAGGNAAVQARIESGEVQVGVLLLESVLAAQAKGSDLTFHYPDDGAVTIPGYAAIFKSTRNPGAAKAFYDLLLSPEGQSAMVRIGLLHAADPRQPGPAKEPGIDALLARSQPWSEQFLDLGVTHGAEIKSAFAEAFSQ